MALCQQPTSFHKQQYHKCEQEQQQYQQLRKKGSKQQRDDSLACCTCITCTYPVILLQSVYHSALTFTKHSLTGR